MDDDAAVAALSALAQQTRLAVFRLLIKAGPEGLAAGAIADRLTVRPNTLSTHLGILLAAGLVVRHRSGRSVAYSADYQGMAALMAYLLEDCCGGNRAICAPLLDSLSVAC